MSEQDIVERLRNHPTFPVPSPENETNLLIREAADTIATLRYDLQRSAEKIAALQRQVEVLERLAGAVSKGDGDFREVTKGLPHRTSTGGISDHRWPLVGTHE